MKDIIIIMKFTIKDMIKRKSFVISTIIILLLIILGFNIPNIIKSISGEESKEKILIVDSKNIFEGSLELLQESDIDYDIEISNIDYEEIKNKIQNKEIESALIIDEEENNIKLKYIIESISLTSEVPQDLIESINKLYTNHQISKLGLSSEQLSSITPNFELSLEGIEEEANGNVFVMMIMSLILFYAIYFCAYQVSSSITIEKTSKIIETLVTSTKPSTIVLGKTIGIGVVGLLQMILIIGTALVSANIFLEKELIEQVLDISSITPYLGFITIIYFILGYFAYAFIYALTGSTISKPEDIQSANSPVAILAIVGFYLSYFTMMNPNSNLNMIASFLPISSPFCMPFRVMMGLASTNDVFISIGILVITIAIIAKISIKIYSSAILNYGTKISLKDIVSICKNK